MTAIALTSHNNFLTFLTFLECFYMILINKKQVWKNSEDFFFGLHPIFDGPWAKLNIEKKKFEKNLLLILPTYPESA
jgi:hypothetical protein